MFVYNLLIYWRFTQNAPFASTDRRLSVCILIVSNNFHRLGSSVLPLRCVTTSSSLIVCSVSVEILYSFDNGWLETLASFTLLLLFLNNSSMPESIRLFLRVSICDKDFRFFDSVWTRTSGESRIIGFLSKSEMIERKIVSVAWQCGFRVGISD